MKFVLIDKIETIEPGERIVTSKAVTLAEEYLQDHFPTFPILPGVLMIEAMTQSAAWLLRVKQDFANSIVTLKTARNVRYSYFLRPGSTLRCEVKTTKIDGEVAKFSGTGHVDDRLAVSAKLELRWTSAQQQGGLNPATDAALIEELKQQFALLSGPAALAAAGAAQPG